VVSTCIVPGCKNSKSKHLAGVSYFQFPEKDPAQWLKWLKTAKNLKYGENATTENQKKRVCSQHFKLDD